MKKLVSALILAASSLVSVNAQDAVKVAIDLNKVQDDKLAVTVEAPQWKADKLTFHIPKTVPGTYSTDNYGKFVENLKAYDSKGKELQTKKTDDNSWEISGAKKLSKVTYLVNDTYDIEDQHSVFSPAGTNIEAGKNFMLNMHGFVGYFQGKDKSPYEITIAHPATLWGATSLTDLDPSDTKDVFKYARYFDVSDHPIMYSKPDYATFKVDDMEILLAVFSPNGTITAEALKPAMEQTMQAQKRFLGPINATKKYAILLYMSDMTKPDAKGFGALEHHTCTTVVFPEMMPLEQLLPALIDTVSHEFFHIVTPLTIHAKEIEDFDYADPKMSEHLWMYEGVTEYFANLFQVNQGLISEDEFLDRMAQKIERASQMDETMSFTEMSKNVLVEPYKGQYLNVYEKGTLIGMCIDIIIREKSNGERGILDLMMKLSREYGMNKAFNDPELFPKIVSLTYPEVGEFLKTHVQGKTPINYSEYFAKVGVSKSTFKVPGHVFVANEQPIITVNPETSEITMIPDLPQSDFIKSMGLKSGDILKSVNGTAYNLDNIYDLLMGANGWKDNDEVTMVVKRAGKDVNLKGKVTVPTMDQEGYRVSDPSKSKLFQAWLKG